MNLKEIHKNLNYNFLNLTSGDGSALVSQNQFKFFLTNLPHNKWRTKNLQKTQ